MDITPTLERLTNIIEMQNASLITLDEDYDDLSKRVGLLEQRFAAQSDVVDMLLRKYQELRNDIDGNAVILDAHNHSDEFDRWLTAQE